MYSPKDIIRVRVELAVVKSGDMVGNSLDQLVKNVYISLMCVTKAIRCV